MHYFFGNAYSQNAIQKLQNSCFRFAFNSNYRDHITPHYISKQILKCKYVYYKQYASLVFNIYKHKKPDYLINLLRENRENHDINTRNRCRLMIPKHKTAKFQHCFDYMATAIINKHFELFISCGTILQFKYKLKNILLLEQSQLL